MTRWLVLLLCCTLVSAALTPNDQNGAKTKTKNGSKKPSPPPAAKKTPDANLDKSIHRLTLEEVAGMRADQLAYNKKLPIDPLLGPLSNYLIGICAKHDVLTQMKIHFYSLRLLKKDTWLFEPLALYHDFLLGPPNTEEFIHEMASCGSDNHYLLNLKELLTNPSPKMKETAVGHSNELASAVAYAIVLDRLSFLLRHSWRLTDALMKYWGNVDQRSFSSMRKVLSLFEMTKFYTIQFCLNLANERVAKNDVDPQSGLHLMFGNIFEALVEELHVNWDFRFNVRAGAVLMWARPGSIQDAASATTISPDKQATYYAPPRTHSWNHLYEVWNMAFISHYPDWPFYMAKLANPQVMCYQKEPREFVHNRVLSLFIHLNWMIFTRGDGIKTAVWNDKEFTSQFGKKNWASSKEYLMEWSVLKPVINAADHVSATFTMLSFIVNGNPPDPAKGSVLDRFFKWAQNHVSRLPALISGQPPKPQEIQNMHETVETKINALKEATQQPGSKPADDKNKEDAKIDRATLEAHLHTGTITPPPNAAPKATADSKT